MSVSEAVIQSDVDAAGLCYPDFVGHINQWNVLPGAYSTLSEWALYSHLNRESSVLQLGCTTGFQSRELAVMSGCMAHGLDLSVYAIQAARWNARKYAPGARLSYERADALKHVNPAKYTHVVVGAGLRFFSKPVEVISHMPEWLVDGGYLLASPFFVHKSVPDKLLALAESTFGIVPTTAGYDEILQPYTAFEIMHESRKTLVLEPESQIERYCEATIARAAQLHDRQDDRVWKQQQFERLFSIRRVSNALREYQGYMVMVLRYRSSVYPNRYVELF